jgi:hypothetical protein
MARRLMTFPTLFLACAVDLGESSSPEVITGRSTLPTEFILFPAPDRNSSRRFLRSPAVAALSAIPVAAGCRRAVPEGADPATKSCRGIQADANLTVESGRAIEDDRSA